jgi:hypothetical protein
VSEKKKEKRVIREIKTSPPPEPVRRVKPPENVKKGEE